MEIHKLAGKQVPADQSADIDALVSSYNTSSFNAPVSFGTSGHRGSSLDGSFNETHIAACVQAIIDYRWTQKISGPLFLGFDTHALSQPAFKTAVEVLAANQVDTFIHDSNEYTPTPVVSFLILEHNRKNPGQPADGIILTPSHNPPEHGGIKYNPPSGGPAESKITSWIENRANQIAGRILQKKPNQFKQIPYSKAINGAFIHSADFITPFISGLSQVVDMDIIQQSGVRIGVDPMGGAGVHFWEPIADMYKLDLDIINTEVDKTFGFMTADWDGNIRMDCSSGYAMAKLIHMADRFDIAWGNDPDFDRHGIVTPKGLMNPNHYLAGAIWFLLQNRPEWKPNLAIGKTLVSSSMIDKVTTGSNRNLYEVPVGFKWFVQGLLKGTLAFGGEESAGAAFLRKNGQAWTTDKDGFSLALLSAEILAKTGRTPDDIYRDTLVPVYGNPQYQRIDSPISEEEKKKLSALTPDSLTNSIIAGKKIKTVFTEAPGNNAAIGGVKLILEDGSWCAVRPSGTEPVMKFYIESFDRPECIQTIHDEAAQLIFS